MPWDDSSYILWSSQVVIHLKSKHSFCVHGEAQMQHKFQGRWRIHLKCSTNSKEVGKSILCSEAFEVVEAQTETLLASPLLCVSPTNAPTRNDGSCFSYHGSERKAVQHCSPNIALGCLMLPPWVQTFDIYQSIMPVTRLAKAKSKVKLFHDIHKSIGR